MFYDCEKFNGPDQRTQNIDL